MSDNGIWMKVRDDHPWLKDDRIGIVCFLKKGIRSRWFSRDGKEWDGSCDDRISTDKWIPIGFEVCTEEQAKEILKPILK